MMGTPPTDKLKLFEDIEELKAAISARDEFLAIAAHELRNPMGAIVLSIQTLRMAAEKYGPDAPPQLHEKLLSLERRIGQYVKRATMLLDVTRLTSGNFQLELESVNLSQLLRELLTDSSDDFQRARCQLSLTLDEEVVGQWDRMALEQLLVNLMSNALKYGAGHPIEIELIADATTAHFQIKDHGIGISEEDQQRIFHKFERAVKRRQHGGFGIGLWVSRQIVAGLGGSISVQSAPGQGSAFNVSLPKNPPMEGTND
jgi:signal transduction histidine kinase